MTITFTDNSVSVELLLLKHSKSLDSQDSVLIIINRYSESTVQILILCIQNAKYPTYNSRDDRNQMNNTKYSTKYQHNHRNSNKINAIKSIKKLTPTLGPIVSDRM